MLKSGKKDCINQYLQAGGSANEILEALSASKGADPGRAVAVLRILNHLFLKCVLYLSNRISMKNS